MVRSDRRTYTNFHILETGIPRLYLQCSEKAAHIRVWKKKIPAELHYGSSDRMGDIVVAPELGWQFTRTWHRHQKGAHGYFPKPRHAGYVSGHRT